MPWVEQCLQQWLREQLSQIMQSADAPWKSLGSCLERTRPCCGMSPAHLQVLFYLSWRLGPILALVIIATAAAAANYKKQTKLVEGTASKTLSDMVGVADQAFRAITTVRCAGLLHTKLVLQQPGASACHVLGLHPPSRYCSKVVQPPSSGGSAT